MRSDSCRSTNSSSWSSAAAARRGKACPCSSPRDTISSTLRLTDSRNGARATVSRRVPSGSRYSTSTVRSLRRRPDRAFISRYRNPENPRVGPARRSAFTERVASALCISASERASRRTASSSALRSGRGGSRLGAGAGALSAARARLSSSRSAQLFGIGGELLVEHLARELGVERRSRHGLSHGAAQRAQVLLALRLGSSAGRELTFGVRLRRAARPSSARAGTLRTPTPGSRVRAGSARAG